MFHLISQNIRTITPDQQKTCEQSKPDQSPVKAPLDEAADG